MELDLSKVNFDDKQNLDEYRTAVRLSPEEFKMLQVLLNKTNLNSVSKLIRLLIRTAYEQNITIKN